MWRNREKTNDHRKKNPSLRVAPLLFGLAALLALRAQGSAAARQQSVAPARFEYGGDAAEVPAAFVGNLVFLPVHVNDSQPFPFLLDTNALATLIAPDI